MNSESSEKAFSFALYSAWLQSILKGLSTRKSQISRDPYKRQVIKFRSQERGYFGYKSSDTYPLNVRSP